MRPTTSLSLADAFLALSDDDGAAGDRRQTLPRMVTATVAAVVLAVGVPLGWYVTPRATHPVAALSSKTALADGEE
jgi:hypothetical protein